MPARRSRSRKAASRRGQAVPVLAVDPERRESAGSSRHAPSPAARADRRAAGRAPPPRTRPAPRAAGRSAPARSPGGLRDPAPPGPRRRSPRGQAQRPVPAVARFRRVPGGSRRGTSAGEEVPEGGHLPGVEQQLLRGHGRRPAGRRAPPSGARPRTAGAARAAASARPRPGAPAGSARPPRASARRPRARPRSRQRAPPRRPSSPGAAPRRRGPCRSSRASSSADLPLPGQPQTCTSGVSRASIRRRRRSGWGSRCAVSSIIDHGLPERYSQARLRRWRLSGLARPARPRHPASPSARPAASSSRRQGGEAAGRDLADARRPVAQLAGHLGRLVAQPETQLQQRAAAGRQAADQVLQVAEQVRPLLVGRDRLRQPLQHRRVHRRVDPAPVACASTSGNAASGCRAASTPGRAPVPTDRAAPGVPAGGRPPRPRSGCGRSPGAA